MRSIALALLLPIIPTSAAAAEPDVLLVAPSSDVGEEAARSLLRDEAARQVVEFPADRVLSDAWVLGAELLDSCPIPSVTAEEVTTTLEQVRDHIDNFEIEQGRALLTGLRPRLGCLESPADTSNLWTLYFLEAVAAFYEEDLEGAPAALERALAVRPGQAFDESYPPALRDLYNEAQARVREPGWATLLAPTDEGAVTLVDGAVVPAAGLTLIGGIHLLQVRGADGVLRGGRLQVQGGDTVVVSPPPSLSALISPLPASEQEQLAAWLWASVAGGGEGDAWLVDDDARVTALGGKAPEQAVTATGRSRAGQPSVQLAVGAGYQRLGRWDYLALDVDVTIRLVGPLRLGVFALPSVGQTRTSLLDETERHTPVLPMFGVGAVVRVPGPVQPVFGAYFQAGPDANQAGDEAFRLLAGVAGLAGVQIPLGRTPLSLQPVVHGGFAGSYGVLRGMLTLAVSL